MNFGQDLRFAIRMLRKTPALTAVAVVTLGLGIGANTAIFSIANGILLHPLPYANVNRLLDLSEVPPHQPATDTNHVSAYNYATWSQQAHAFQAITAYQYVQMNLSGVGTPAEAQGALVEPNFFQVLPSQPLRGRLFLPEEGQPGGDREVILSRRLWQHQFAADPNLVGRTVELNQEAYTVVGIVGDDAHMPEGAELWMPLALTPQQLDDRTSHYLHVVAELKPGTTIAAAKAEMRTLVQRVDAQYPATNRDWGINVQTLSDRTIGSETASYVYLLQGAVGFLLLIACANVGNLQFARALGRNQELAIRHALGAGRGRIVSQLLTENILLGLGGAAVGALFAAFSIRLILGYMPADVAVFIGGWDHVRLDGTALLFMLLVAIAAGVVAGLAPAWHASRPDVNATLKEGGRGAIGRSRHRLRGALVVLQVALALTLLVGAALMVQGFDAHLNVDQAFDPATTLTAAVNLPNLPHYAPDSARAEFYQQALGRLGSLPGVQDAGVASLLPLGNDLNGDQFSIQGRPIADASQARSAAQQSVSPNFFTLLHLPILSGRAFTASDGPSAPGVAIISQRLARRDWPGRSPIGDQIKLGADNSANPWLTVVGVAADAQWAWGDPTPEVTLYRPVAQAPQYSAFFLLRGAGGGDVTNLGPAARQAVAQVDPDQPLFSLMSLDESIHEASIGISYVAVMLTVAGVLALILAAVGVYGVMAFLVSERVHEFGIRRALGATPGAIIGLVLRRGAVMLAWGFALGLPLAFLLARALQGLILGIGAGDLPTYAWICLILAAMAALACYLPARRATRVDPLVALREP